jgi:hypothetical protein
VTVNGACASVSVITRFSLVERLAVGGVRECEDVALW